MDIFAQFFIEPLILQNSIEREREAVDSEFELRFTNDYRRLLSVTKKLAKENHPMRGFGTGNKNTLTLKNVSSMNSLKNIKVFKLCLFYHQGSDEDLYKILHDFRKRYYTAQSMTLVVQSQESLETLENWVTSLFSKVPNNGLEKDTFDFPYDEKRFPCLIKAVPIEKKDQLKVRWTFPPLRNHFKTKPLWFISHMLGR